MANQLESLRERLVNEPFNQELRKQYAQLLFNEGQFNESLTQWQLLLQSDNSNQEYLETINRIQAHLNADHPGDDAGEPDPKVRKLKLVQGSGGHHDMGNVVSHSRTDKVRFVDIAGMADLKKLVRRRIIDPFINPGLFQKFKRKAGGGVLLYGPPGCGKTMMARAIATECKASFNAVGISDILNMYIGESESNLSSIFDRARSETPAVLFFDELDALAYSRSKANSDHTRTLVNEFLNQLDGVSGNNEQILILGATNMPWDVDDAMKRPGRFDRQIFVPPPDTEAIAEMLKIKLRDVPCDEFDAQKIAAQCEHFSGADIDGLIEYAKDLVLDDIMDNDNERDLSEADLLDAAHHVTPSTTDWLKTARNLVKYGNAGGMYKEVEQYLRSRKMY